MIMELDSRRVWSINRGCLLLLGTWSHLRYIWGFVLAHLFLWFVFPTCILRLITLWCLSHFIFHLKSSTPSYMVYGKPYRFPLYITIFVGMISFWTDILTCTENKIVCVLYDFLRMQHFKESISNSWINGIHKILSLCGVSNIWQEQNSLDKNSTIAIVRQWLSDQFIQKWESDLNNSSKGQIYRLFKSHFGREKYLEILPAKIRKTFIKFRTLNHRLPIEIGRWANFTHFVIPVQIADEFHYILECESLCAIRK
jgi:dimeric dUTPase (all-alpha-NTP-PPase superfamily)